MNEEEPKHDCSDVTNEIDILFIKYQIGELNRKPRRHATQTQLVEMLFEWKNSGMSENTKILLAKYRPKHKPVEFIDLTNRLEQMSAEELTEYSKELSEIINNMPKLVSWEERKKTLGLTEPAEPDPLLEIFNTLTQEQREQLSEDLRKWDDDEDK